MGLTAVQIGQCSLWQFNAMAEGWNRANGGDDLTVEPPTYEEFKHFMEAPVGGWPVERMAQ